MRPILRNATIAGSIAALLIVTGTGARARGRVGAPETAGQVPQQQPPTFRSAVQAVRTDAIVRDAKGNFVGNLTKDDFEVYEDGVKQDIVWLEKVQGGRVFAPAPLPQRPREEGIILPPPPASTNTASRVFVFFVDDLHLSFGETSRLRGLFSKIARELVHDGDQFAMVSTGPSSIAIDLTYDRKQLESMIGRITGGGLAPSDIITAPQTAEGPSEVRYRAHVAFATALDLIAKLEKITDRRKAVVYVSEGYDFNPFADARSGEDPAFAASAGQARQMADQQSSDPSRQGPAFADADLARELSELTRAANRANATIYTIDPRGLSGGPDLSENLSPTVWQDYIRKAHDSLRVLAENTGGFAVVDQNDLSGALKKIDADTSDYYMLAYYPTNPDPLKRTRQIEVRVTRKGLTVWSRRSYALKPTK
jgi:VWFA-related protein